MKVWHVGFGSFTLKDMPASGINLGSWFFFFFLKLFPPDMEDCGMFPIAVVCNFGFANVQV